MHPLGLAVRADHQLVATLTRESAIDTPRVGQPAVIVDGYLTGLEKLVPHRKAVSAAMQPRPTAVRNGLVLHDPEREIGLQELVRYVGERRPQGMTIRTVTGRPAGYPAESDLIQLIPLPILVITRVHEVGTVREARSAKRIRRTLPQQTTHDIEYPPQHMGARAQCSGSYGLENRSAWNPHFDQVVKPVVEKYLRIKQVDEEGAQKHLEHFFI